MSTTTRAAATATLLALPLGLTACGGSGDSVSVSSTSSSPASSSSSAPAPSSTSTTPSPSSTSSSSPSSSSSSSSSTDDSKKPTKAAATAGLNKALGDTAVGKKAPPARVKKLAVCIVDKTYDKLSNKSLNAFVSGDQAAQLESKDNTVYLAAAKTCGEELGASQ